MNLPPVTLVQLQDAAQRLTVRPCDRPYLAVYPLLIEHFQRIDRFDPVSAIAAAHAVYGWMPAMLAIRPPVSETGAELSTMLNAVHSGAELPREQLAMLKSIVNNSMIGASKLLHFCNPNLYPIWDRRVFRKVSGLSDKESYEYRVNSVDTYTQYFDNCINLINMTGFESIEHSVNAKLKALDDYDGYQITRCRAFEMVLFLSQQDG